MVKATLKSYISFRWQEVIVTNAEALRLDLTNARSRK